MMLVVGHRGQTDTTAKRSIEKMRAAEEYIFHSEARFRALYETSSNCIFCYSFEPPLPINLPIEEQIKRSNDAILAECNQVFVRTFPGMSMADVIGTRMGILDGNRDTAAHHKYFSEFIKNDYRLANYELVYKTRDGETRAVRSSLSGIVSDGHLHRFWASESDVLDLHESQLALAQRKSYQELIADISSRLLKANESNGHEVIEACMGDICQHFEADRATVVWYNQKTEAVEEGFSWSRTGADFKIPATINAYPRIVELVSNNEWISVDDTAHLPDGFEVDQERILANGSKAFVILPLTVEGVLHGASSFAMLDQPRSWTAQEIADMHVFSELFANFVLRLRSRKELSDALNGLRRATDKLEAENVYLRQEVERTAGFDEIIGESADLLNCLRLVEVVANTDAPVLILGETGTGKELIARAVHQHSDRSDRALVKVNCAALPANLIESELFGYEKGAFTGADRAKLGRFDLASGSTLFLDEIGDIPLELQSKLLRVLQEGEFERLGGSETIKVDVRIVAATNKDLNEAILNGEFRADLYYRISTFPIGLPPLRERGDDIQALAEHFITSQAKTLGREIRAISAETVRAMREYDWPGNVRELEGVIQRAMISSSGPVLELAGTLSASVYTPLQKVPRILSSTIGDLRLVEREHIVAILEDTNWKVSGKSGAAAALGIPPSTLRSKMKKLSIVRPH